MMAEWRVPPPAPVCQPFRREPVELNLLPSPQVGGGGRNTSMKKIIFVISILVLSLSVSSCEIIWGTTNPEKEANGHAIRVEAGIAEDDAELAREQNKEMFALELEVANAAKNEEINAQKISIYADEYLRTAVKLIGVFELGMAAFALAYALGGTSRAFVKFANKRADLIYPDRRTGLFPIQQYALLGTGGKKVFAVNYGTGEVLSLNSTKPADRQMITGLLALQQTYIQTNAAVRGRDLRHGAGGFDSVASVQPELIMPQESELVENVKTLMAETGDAL